MKGYLRVIAFIQAAIFMLAPSGGSVAQEPDREVRASIGSSENQVNETLLRGIHLLYNREFEKAEGLFRAVERIAPDRPGAYFYLAMVSWSRLAAGFWSSDEVAQFKKRIDRTIAVAKTRFDKGKGDSYTYFYLGGALGFDGRFELMEGNWITSFFLASDAIDALKTCHDLNPDNKDVLLGLGTFDYYTARLSGFLKFLTYFLLHKGNKAEGLRKLTIAADEAVYSATEAKSMLLHIYLFLENDLEKASAISEALSRTYALNPRFKVLHGVSLIRLGKESQYRTIVNELQKEGDNCENAFQAAAWRRRAVYLESIFCLFKGDYAGARAKLWDILSDQDPKHDPAMIAWPRIKLGMSYDLEGERDKAVAIYEDVLHMKNGAGAQFLAEKLINKPLRKGDPFIGY
ncbi:MAG: hypothetical protein P8165_16825 [Deltaproteobacteria bacterium]